MTRYRRTNPEQVAAVRELGIAGIEEGDLARLLRVQADASLDAVLAFDVIEHFEREKILVFVDQVRRVLKPGGRWIVHVPNGASILSGRIRYGDLIHELPLTCSSLTQLMLSSGYSRIQCFDDAPPVHGPVSALRWLLWHAFRCVIQLYVVVETGELDPGQPLTQNLLAVV